jgi:hypothetical protein
MVEKRSNAEDIWEVLPADEMRRKYGLYAENRPVIVLDPVREGISRFAPIAPKTMNHGSHR